MNEIKLPEIPEEGKKSIGIIGGATGTAALLGTLICPGIGSAIGAGIGAILSGTTVIIKTIKENK